MLCFHLFICCVTALQLRNSLDDLNSYTFRHFPQPNLGFEPSELNPTDNVLHLSKVNTPSPSNKILQSIRSRHYTLSKRSTNGTSPLLNVENGQVFVAPITVGGQSFHVVIDSGSSDPWLVSTDFTCLDPATDSVVDESSCDFGPLYDPSLSPTYESIPDQNFNVSYADDETLTGKMGYETISLGGITVAKQEFGVVDSASWYGDGTSSGLVGFAYRALTSAFAGTDSSADSPSTAVKYNPLFANMFGQGSVQPVFSVVVNRNASGSGLLGLGGIPEGVVYSPYMVNTPILPSGVEDEEGNLVYEFYAIQVTGFAVAGEEGTQFDPFTEGKNPLKTGLMGTGTQMIVDTGTSLVYAPDEVAANLAALYMPAATWDQSRLAYEVDCDAETPVFGVAVEGKIFYVNPQDLVVQINETACIMGVQPSLGGLSILGGVWLKNVVAVFDIGAGQMRFAAREFYSLYDASVEQNT